MNRTLLLRYTLFKHFLLSSDLANRYIDLLQMSGSLYKFSDHGEYSRQLLGSKTFDGRLGKRLWRRKDYQVSVSEAPAAASCSF